MRKPIILFNLLIFLILLILTSCSSDNSTDPYSKKNTPIPDMNWERANGPFAGRVDAFAIDPNGNFYCASEGNVYLSEDNGDEWRKILEFGTNSYVSFIKINSNNDVFIGESYKAVHRSSDNGNTWTNLTSHLGEISPRCLIFETNGNILLSASQGLYRSADDGSTWNLLGFENSSKYIDMQCCILPNGRIIVSAGYSIFYSDNNGNSWTEGNIDGAEMYCLTICDNGNLLAGAHAKGIYASKDNGENWENISTDLFENSVWFIYKNLNGRLFTSTNKTLYVSDDNAETWTQMFDDQFQSAIKTVNSDNEGVLFIGTDRNGLFKADASGLNIEHIAFPLNIIDIAVDNKGEIVVCTRWDGYYQSSNHGENWSLIDPLGFVTINASSTIHSDGTIVISNWSGTFFSYDHGTSFVYFDDLQYDPVNIMAVNEDGYIYGGKAQNGIYRSHVNGCVFVSLGLNFTHVTCAAINSVNKIYAGTTDGLFCFEDNGKEWKEINEFHGQETEAVAIDTEDHIFIVSSGKFYQSFDEGKTWKNIYEIKASQMVVTNDGIIFIMNEQGIWASGNYGKSWSEQNANLPDITVNKMIFSPAGYLLLGSSSEGVFKSSIL